MLPMPYRAAWTVILVAVGLAAGVWAKEADTVRIRAQPAPGTAAEPVPPEPPPPSPAGDAAASVPSTPDGWQDAITGAQVDEPAGAVAIYVDAAKGDDAATGEPGRPVQSLALAADLAGAALDRGESVRVRLAPGTYREAVAFPAPTGDGALVIEGTKTGAVTIAGSDDWSDPERWSPVPRRPGVLAAPWPREWGDPMVCAEDAPMGPHPPRLTHASAPDDGTAVIEWIPPVGLNELAGYRIDRRDGAGEGATWREVMRVGPATGRLVDESIAGAAPDAAVFAYRVAAVDSEGKGLGVSRAVRIHAGRPRAPWRRAAAGRRREMVLVDGEVLRQAVTMEDLTPGSYVVDDGAPADAADGRLYLALPSGARRGSCTIEVALRPEADAAAPLLAVEPHADGAGRNVVVRKLVFVHHAGRGPQAAALRIRGCRNVLVEDCAFRWNNAAGMQVAAAADVTLRRCTAAHNGGAGIRCAGSINLLVEELAALENNWRGDRGGVAVGGVAGIVLGPGAGRCRLSGVRAADNRCPGVWLSRATGHVAIDDLEAVGNAREGLVVSDPDGPVIVRGATIAQNERAGLLLAGAQRGVLEECVLYGNAGSQIEVLAPPSPQTPVHATLARRPARCTRHWRWRNNVVVSTGDDVPLVRAPADADFMGTLSSGRNLWFGPDEDHAFLLAEMGFPLEVWQQVTGQDRASRFIAPRLRKPEALDFRPAGDSPWHQRESWPEPTATAANLARLAQYRAVRAAVTTAPPYAALADAVGAAWHTVDLATVANRPLAGRDAWLGSPLPELAPGQRVIHGVPFVIPDAAASGGRAAVVLRSAHALATAGAAVPAEVTVPVGRKARTVYLLHGCAQGDRFAPAAYYDLVYADGTTAGLDVVPLGNAPEDTTRLAERKRLATVQDWRPEALHFATERARAAMIVGEDNPAGRVRYLYTVRWPNPHPEKTIRGIRLASADPEQDVTVGVLAVTLRVE